MKKILLLFTFFLVGLVTEASNQVWDGRYSDSDALVRAVFDSLELIKGPADLDLIPVNKRKAYTIRICNQQKFDNLSSLLHEALENGQRNIRVQIKKGTYFFNDGHLKMVGQHYPNADIRIEGCGVAVVPKGWELKDGDNIPCDVSGESCFIDVNNKKSVNPWGEMSYADTLIEVVNEKSKLCRLKCAALGNLIVTEGNMAYLELTRWCRCYQYKVLRIENGCVDFYAPDLQMDSVFRKPYFNVNYDFVFGKQNPRFRLCNSTSKETVSVIDRKVRLSGGLKRVYLGNSAVFLSLNDSEFRFFSMRGITFLGNRPDPMPLLLLNKLTAKKIEISNCRFIGQRGRVVSVNCTDNVCFHDNLVRDNHEYGLRAESTCANTTVVNNVFENNGLNLSCNRCVTCCGTDYYIAHNTFKNFGYCAISVGAWYGTELIKPSSGIVEYNEMWYDNKYFTEAWKYTIMDGGAIYVWTQNDRSIIRYNYIHDYTGMSQNRGIFLDDGAHHVAVYGNIVLDTPQMHSIDSRRVAGTERSVKKESYSERNNIDNLIVYNILDGTINFAGREEVQNGCMMGGNVILKEKGNRLVANHGYNAELKNIEVVLNNIEIGYDGYDNSGIIISGNKIDAVKRLPCYDKIKKWIKPF